MIGRSPEAISNIERNLSLPSVETLVRISDTFEVSPNFFLTSNPEDGKSDWKTKKISELTSIAYKFSRDDLELAIRQLRAFK